MYVSNISSCGLKFSNWHPRAQVEQSHIILLPAHISTKSGHSVCHLHVTAILNLSVLLWQQVNVNCTWSQRQQGGRENKQEGCRKKQGSRTLSGTSSDFSYSMFNSLEGHSQKMRHDPPPSQSHLSFTQVDDKVGEILSPHPSNPPSPLNIPAAGHSISWRM